MPALRTISQVPQRSSKLCVVVVAVHADAGELVHLLLGQHAQRARDVDVDDILDRLHALAHLAHQPLVRATHGGDDAELRRPGRGGLLRCLDQRRDVQPGRTHRRVEHAGLRAEVTVLGAATGLQRDDALDLDLVPAPLSAYLVRQVEQLVDAVVGQAQRVERLLFAEPDALLEDLRARDVQDVGQHELLRPGGPVERPAS
jgi:hypothetical protein